MDKQLGRILTFSLYVIFGLLLAAALGGLITQKPMLLVAIKSNSMYPTLQRGDAVLIQQLNEGKEIKKGDIIVFRSESGSLASQGWIMHRVAWEDPESGYITVGDNNKRTDQESGGAPPIQREWIASRALTLGDTPVKLPLLGYIPLWMEELHTHPMILPGIALILGIVVAAGELTGKKKKRNRNLEQQILYFFSGLTLAVMLAASMLATSQHMSFVYEVANNKGILSGSSVGILEQGEVVERSLSDIKNDCFFPIIASVTSNDPQITLSHDLLLLKPGAEEKVEMVLTASDTGQYKASVWVGMFLPLLPPFLVHFLAQINFWLALIAVSLVPALPLILYPVLEPRLRRRTQTEIRRMFRRMGRALPF